MYQIDKNNRKLMRMQQTFDCFCEPTEIKVTFSTKELVYIFSDNRNFFNDFFSIDIPRLGTCL